MADDFDRVDLICKAVKDGPAWVPGSVRDEYCMDCATEVWMSPQMKAYWDEHPDSIVRCPECGAIQMEAEESIGNEVEVRAVPGDRLGEALLKADPDLIQRAYGRDQA